LVMENIAGVSITERKVVMADFIYTGL
jgi:hypothetical protein